MSRSITARHQQSRVGATEGRVQRLPVLRCHTPRRVQDQVDGALRVARRGSPALTGSFPSRSACTVTTSSSRRRTPPARDRARPWWSSPADSLLEHRSDRGRLGGVAEDRAGRIGVDVARRLWRTARPAGRASMRAAASPRPSGCGLARVMSRRPPAPSRRSRPDRRPLRARPPPHRRRAAVPRRSALNGRDDAVRRQRPTSVEQCELVRLDQVAGRDDDPLGVPLLISAAASATAVLAETQALV